MRKLSIRAALILVLGIATASESSGQVVVEDAEKWTEQECVWLHKQVLDECRSQVSCSRPFSPEFSMPTNRGLYSMETVLTKRMYDRFFVLCYQACTQRKSPSYSEFHAAFCSQVKDASNVGTPQQKPAAASTVADPHVYAPFKDAAEQAKNLAAVLKAAEQGDRVSQLTMGNVNAEGIWGVKQNKVEAAKWFRRAADQGVPGGQVSLGEMYANGEGVPQDYVLAHMWFNVATMRGYAKAGKHRDGIEQRMTPAQIAEAQKLAREWKPKPER